MRTFLAALLLATPVMVHAADAEPVGHYYLEGIMETGSELLLRPDGRYSWYLTYGALDQASEGNWARVGDIVTLTSARSARETSPFETMVLRIDGNDLIPEQGRGRYVRHPS